MNNNQPGTNNQSKKDTSKTNTNKWKNENAQVTYERLNSAKVYIPDTSLHSFHRLQNTEPWYQDMGNLGSPANNLLFTPEEKFGPTLGYHAYDANKFNIDSLNYYNTNRPYSVFGYRLGSKLEQLASIMHSQNIKPNWNFAVEYHKLTSAGNYKIQRNNNDNLYLSTNYKSLDKHYTLYFAMVYNKEQHDENGGIKFVNQLDTVDNTGAKIYSDRKTIDVVNQNDQYSITRSPVYNNQREFTLLLQHSYRWGKTDTSYSKDSTQFSFKLKPRFSLTHKLELSTEKHTYNNLIPDSTTYIPLFNHTFTSTGNGYYTTGEDSVFTEQKWFWIDNKILFNGFLGQQNNQTQFSAGIGNRYDQFISAPVTNNLPNNVSVTGQDEISMVHNYLEGLIKKEALAPGQWEYSANAKLFFSGQDAGNFMVHAVIGRELKNNTGSFSAGFHQQINSVPYSYSYYENIYTKDTFHLNNEIVNILFANLESPRFRLSGGVKNYLINNYIYVDQYEHPNQYNISFSITQVWVRKVFKVGKFYLDNEIAYQQKDVNTPVNIPAFMGKHQLSFEHTLFNKALRVSTGFEMRYNSPYKPSGYSVLLNKFFYQNNSTVTNSPEVSYFLNFRVKSRFRAFIMADHLQLLIPALSNSIVYVGAPQINNNNEIPVYASQNTLLRIGFSWVLIN